MAEFYEHWLNVLAQEVFGDERPDNWVAKLAIRVRKLNRAASVRPNSESARNAVEAHKSPLISKLEVMSILAATSTADPTVEELEGILDRLGDMIEECIQLARPNSEPMNNPAYLRQAWEECADKWRAEIAAREDAEAQCDQLRWENERWKLRWEKLYGVLTASGAAPAICTDIDKLQDQLGGAVEQSAPSARGATNG